MIAFQTLTVSQLLGELNPQEQKVAPPRLFVAGDPDIVRYTGKVSVVGSREASPDGLDVADRVARLLVDLDLTVVSGLARGIDTAAHKAALRAKGRTVAVIGTGLDRAYPKENAKLQQWIAEHHAVVSQFEVGRRVERGAFPRRNITMALLSDATVIIEASEESGTRHQGWAAIRLGRPVFLSESVASSVSWAPEMASYGAMVFDLKSIGAALREIPIGGLAAEIAF